MQNCALTDIHFVSSLRKLTNLDMRGNNIKDLSPLHRLTSLNKLNLATNNIGDLTPLAGLKNLTVTRPFLLFNDEQRKRTDYRHLISWRTHQT